MIRLTRVENRMYDPAPSCNSCREKRSTIEITLGPHKTIGYTFGLCSQCANDLRVKLPVMMEHADDG